MEQAVRALITGITGQDGSYLAEQLLEEGAEVFGLVRHVSDRTAWRLAAIQDHPRLQLLAGDVLDHLSLLMVIDRASPDEVYHLAAHSDVASSFGNAVYAHDVIAGGTVRLLDAVEGAAPRARVYVAGTSEMFGNAERSPQDESTPFAPVSPYGAAKVAAVEAARAARRRGLFVSCGLLFNHESPRRGNAFVTQKVVRGLVKCARSGGQLRLGNLEARRDWGWAPDYVRAMTLMVRHREPLDLVAATGTSYSVRDLLDVAGAAVGVRWADHVVVDPALMRPAEVHALLGDPWRAEQELGWRTSVKFVDVVRRMVAAEVARIGGAA